MARFARLRVLTTMLDTGVVPVFCHADVQIAETVERFCARELPNLIAGVGSIVDPDTASLYINCGANFVVGPILNPEVARPATGARSRICPAAAVLPRSRKRKNPAVRS